MSKTWWVVLGVVVVVGLYTLTVYNSLAGGAVAIDGEWAQVETQYQRRFDLIPNLVAAVKGIMNQEQKVFGDLAEARTKYAGAVTVNDKAKAASAVESSFGRLIAVLENYPVLKSSENVTTLMVQLEGTENRISVERSRFNETVQNYNLATKRFPSSILARLFGFGSRDYFEAAKGAAVAPKVEL